MSSYPIKHQLFAQFARVGKALGHPHRLALLEFLAQGERSVDRLARLSGLTTANTSQHLQQLRQAGLVTTRKETQFVHYQLVGDEVVELLEALHRVAEQHLVEVEHLMKTHFASKDSLEPIPAEELLLRIKKKRVTLIDVRPPEEYIVGHVVGALNIPLEELERHWKKLSTGHEIVAYCRGPYCLLAYEAVAILRRKGLKARRMEKGFPEWRQAGFPVEA